MDSPGDITGFQFVKNGQRLPQEYPNQVRERGSPLERDVFIVTITPVVVLIRFTCINGHDWLDFEC